MVAKLGLVECMEGKIKGVRTHCFHFRDQNGRGDDHGDAVMIPGSIVLLLILPSCHLQRGCHAVKSFGSGSGR
jgi:hypothetical protein